MVNRINFYWQPDYSTTLYYVLFQVSVVSVYYSGGGVVYPTICTLIIPYLTRFSHSCQTKCLDPCVCYVISAVLGEFNISPQDLAVPEGSIAFFECDMDTALPPPTYTWYKGDVPVVPDQTRVFISNMTHTLLMRDVSMGDQGSYRCRAENSAGYRESSSASLTLRSPDHFNGENT